MSQNFEQNRAYNQGNQQPGQQPVSQPQMNQQPMMQQPAMQDTMMPQSGMYPGMYQPGRYQPGMYQPGMQQTMPSYYIDDMDDRDREYLKKLHPELNQRILKYIEEECSKMDYDGSPMYDEYPDHETIEQMIDRIYERIVNEMPEVLEEPDMDRQRIPRYRLIRSLTGALLLSELFGRRQRYRRRYPYDYFYGYPSYQYPYYGYPYYQYPYPYYY